MARGHSVAWYTGDEYREKVEATGATFFPHVHAPDRDVSQMDAEFPDRAKLKGIAKFKFDVREVFIAAVPGQVADLEAMLDEVRPDVIVAEPGMAAAAKVIEQRHGIPWATCNISAFAMRSADSAPFGLGLDSDAVAARPPAQPRAERADLPDAVPLDRPRLRRHARHARHGGGRRRSVRRDAVALPLPAADRAFVRVPARRPRAAGALRRSAAAAGPGRLALPAWWDEMLADPRPVVLVTQGTVATDPDELLLPSLDALRDEPVQVVAVTGGPDPAELPAPPPNARVERFVPFAALMPHVAAVITNGGYGGLHFALAHGVPLVVAGASEEKPELVARVNWSGVRRRHAHPAAGPPAAARGRAARARRAGARRARRGHAGGDGPLRRPGTSR